jgi:hypothetical protein
MTREEAIEEIRYYCQDSEEIIQALGQDIYKVLDTINFEEKWLLDVGYSCSNVNTAFKSIKHDLRKLVRK